MRLGQGQGHTWILQIIMMLGQGRIMYIKEMMLGQGQSHTWISQIIMMLGQGCICMLMK